MSVLPVGFGSSGSSIDTGDIPASLRFRSSASAYLSKTFGAPTNAYGWAYATWIKLGNLGTRHPLLNSFVDPNNRGYLEIDDSGVIRYDDFYSGALRCLKVSTPVYRDPSGWVHVFCLCNTDNATAEDRLQIYVNGVRITSWSSSTNYGLSVAPMINSSGRVHYINNINGNYGDGYRARTCFVDNGVALTPASFIRFNTEINEWVSRSASSIKAVVDAGGTNSFMLDFDDATSLTTLGNDYSSKNNDWTLNNFSLTAGTTYDHMLDVPGNSFATLNPLVRAAGVTTLSAANLNLACNFSATYPRVYSDRVVSSGKWYWEVTMSSGAPTQLSVGVAGSHREPFASGSGGYYADEWMYIGGSGQKYNNNSSAAYGATFASGDVIGVALDMDAGTIEFYKNNTTQGQAYTGISGDIRALISSPSGTSHSCSINFGQRPFAYTPPTGFKALCQANLADIDPTSLLNPEDHHVDIAVTKSGDTNFTLPWSADTYDTFFEIKRRNGVGDWYQIDGLRGYTKILKSNSTAAETTDANVLGVSGTTCTLKSTLADGTYIVSATKAGLAAARQTNTDGSITSTVSRNVDSGFAIVLYTGTGSVNSTVGHGLGSIPGRIIPKARTDGTYAWNTWHKNLGSGYYIQLNTTSPQDNSVVIFPAGGVTSLLWNTGNASPNYNNLVGITYVAYCYADSAIQKSFSYTGNGSADGAYADVGFKMGRALLKCSTTTGNWTVLDSERSTSNVADDVIYENLTNAEATSALADLNSRAIKFRIATDPNSAQTFIGHAWAAVTGKYSNSR